MTQLLPILSTSLEDILRQLVDSTDDEIAKEILKVHRFNEQLRFVHYDLDFLEEVKSFIGKFVTDEVRMISVRDEPDDLNVSFLPKDKEAIYSSDSTWSKKNRQIGKPAKIFQKLLVREFKQAEWEIFTNRFKAELCHCNEFEIVSGPEITHWYNEENYFQISGTLGNSCMRYKMSNGFFALYEDNAKMLITRKNGLLTGRALLWEVDGVTIMDRVYTCFDYLENCFYNHAKENKWYIRTNNHLLNTGDQQHWYGPEDNYNHESDKVFTITFDKTYKYFPYVDSFRYYDGMSSIATGPIYDICLDRTDGSTGEETQRYVCANCGHVSMGYDDEIPDDMCYSDHCDEYYCTDCCWWCETMSDYYPDSDISILVYGDGSIIDTFPLSYIKDHLVNTPVEINNLWPQDYFVKINQLYYYATCDKVAFNLETNCYEIRSDTDEGPRRSS